MMKSILYCTLLVHENPEPMKKVGDGNNVTLRRNGRPDYTVWTELAKEMQESIPSHDQSALSNLIKIA